MKFFEFLFYFLVIVAFIGLVVAFIGLVSGLLAGSFSWFLNNLSWL